MRARRAAGVVLSVVFAAPIVFMALGSLRAPGAASPPGDDLLPPLSLDSFQRAFELQPLGSQLWNSAQVALIAVPLSVLVASWAGFGLTLLPPRARRLGLGLSLILLVVPLSALWVPRFVLFSELGLADSKIPLVAPALLGTSPLYVLLFYWSYRRIPRELIDAGRLEGLRALGLWRRIAAPLVRPTTFAVGALAFVFHWGNFVDPLLYLFDPDGYTLPLGMRALAELGPRDFGTLMAAALVATVPAVIAFALVQDRFLAGTRRGGWIGR